MINYDSGRNTSPNFPHQPTYRYMNQGIIIVESYMMMIMGDHLYLCLNLTLDNQRLHTYQIITYHIYIYTVYVYIYICIYIYVHHISYIYIYRVILIPQTIETMAHSHKQACGGPAGGAAWEAASEWAMFKSFLYV